MTFTSIGQVGACLLHLSCLYWGKADEASKHGMDGSTCTSLNNTNTNSSIGTVNSTPTSTSTISSTSIHTSASPHTWPPVFGLPPASPVISPVTSAKDCSGNGDTSAAAPGDIAVIDGVNGVSQDGADNDCGDYADIGDNNVDGDVDDVQTSSGESKEQDQHQDDCTDVGASVPLTTRELYEKALVLARDAGTVFATINCDDLAGDDVVRFEICCMLSIHPVIILSQLTLSLSHSPSSPPSPFEVTTTHYTPSQYSSIHSYPTSAPC